ncbi:MAG: hypothetical protein U5K56_19970 [Halioglobus sp.]|nr:hypothetical protein [Halioglobus sp.]
MNSGATQSSQLLSSLFRDLDEEQRLSVLHLGPPLQETLEFFSGHRCRLQVVDLFAELPLPAEEETENGLVAHMRQLLQFPVDARFDACLFWDLFNYLDAPALTAFLDVLVPHLSPACLAHGFSIHNPRTPQAGKRYGISATETLSVRARKEPLPGYAPHSQNQLKALLHCFDIERTVLLADKRLEFLLRARAQDTRASELRSSARV